MATLDWASKRQAIITDASGAAELVAAHTGLRTAGLVGMGLADVLRSPLYLWSDNGSVLAAAKGRCRQDWLAKKPLAIRGGCLADAVCLRMLEVGYVPTEEQQADGCTKALDRLKHEAWCRSIGLQQISVATQTILERGVRGIELVAAHARVAALALVSFV